MKVKVSFDNVPSSKAFKSFVKDQVVRVREVLGSKGRVEVVVSANAHEKESRMKMLFKGKQFHVKASADNYHAAVSKALEKLLRRVKDKKDKRSLHRGRDLVFA